MLLEFDRDVPPFEPEPAQAGRSDRFMLAACVELPFRVPALVLAVRFASVPKPCGARPRSVAVPCAAQVRPPFALVTGRLFAAPAIDGGRPCDSWFWRPLAAVLPVVLPKLFGTVERPPTCPTVRPADKLVVFTVRTGILPAPAAGAVRATTDRFCTDVGGIARAVVFAAPNAL